MSYNLVHFSSRVMQLLSLSLQCEHDLVICFKRASLARRFTNWQEHRAPSLDTQLIVEPVYLATYPRLGSAWCIDRDKQAVSVPTTSESMLSPLHSVQMISPHSSQLLSLESATDSPQKPQSSGKEWPSQARGQCARSREDSALLR